MNVIGISGVAGSGKDTFYEILSRKYKCKRYALADDIKLTLKEFIYNKHNVDIFNCSREDKDKIRHEIVNFAKAKRFLSKGTYFWSILNQKIFNDDSFAGVNNGFICITDIRYCQYTHDEYFWLKNILNGKLVHVTRLDKEGTEIPPANEEEASQNPILKKLADHKIIWPSESDKSLLDMYVEEAILKLNWNRNERIS